MGLTFDVTGTDRVRRAAQAVDRAARGGLQRELRDRLTGSLTGLERRVRAEMPASMPNRYAAVLAPDTDVDVQVSGGWPQITATADAGRRHLVDVNAGRLRHPVYGRNRLTSIGVVTNPWVTQPVRGGFWDRAIAAYQLNIRRAAEVALRNVAERITG